MRWPRWKNAPAPVRHRWICLRPPPAADLPTPSATEALLAQINPDALSPREALEALYQLKATLATP